MPVFYVVSQKMRSVLSRNTIPEDAFTGEITENAALACLPSQNTGR